MIISFFEEYPTKENLDKLKFVKWKTKLYIGAKSYSDFLRIKKGINAKNVEEIIYWPLLDVKEGYWISPFAKRSALKRIFEEVKGPFMIDAELPTTKNPLLFLTQFVNFFRNRKLIRQNCSGAYVAEYYPVGRLKEMIMSFFGLHYDPKYGNKIIKMMYHSMHSFSKDNVFRMLKKGVEEYGDKYLVAYGTLAVGEKGTEPILSTEQLKMDLGIAKEVGIGEVVMYRLGGMNKEFADVMSKV